MSFFLTRSTRNQEEQDALATESTPPPTATTPLSPNKQRHVAIDVRATMIHHKTDADDDAECLPHNSNNPRIIDRCLNASNDNDDNNMYKQNTTNHGILKTDDHHHNNSAATPLSPSPSPSLSSIPSVRLFQDRPLWQRVLLTINVIVCVPMYSMLLCLGIYIWILQIYWNVIWFRTLWLLYLPYCVLDPTPTNRRRWCGWPCWSWPEAWRRRLRNAPCFTWVGYYFPVTLIKTCELDPHQHNYLFLYHPHGVIGMGANTALNTNGANFEQVFPGIRRSSVTLNACFWAPLFREWMLAIGFISANKTTILQTLQHESVVLVPGGAAEALHAHEGVCKFYLQQRKGFCRLALEASCPLIPCIAFGENEAFSTYYMAPPRPKDDVDSNNHASPSSRQQQQEPYSCSLPPPSSSAARRMLWHVQQRLLRCLTFSTPILLNPIPRPHRIHVVVGSPVPPLGTVDELHAQYLQAIRTLYHEHQDQYGYKHVPLEII